MIKIRTAGIHEHDKVMEIAKTSKYTRDFSHMMFSGEAAYQKEWIRVAEEESTGVLVGFYCVRHKVRSPETTMYFITVRPGFTKLGVASALLEDLKAQCPNNRIVLNVMNDNKPALGFYAKHGFNTVGPALKGKGVQLSLEW